MAKLCQAAEYVLLQEAPDVVAACAAGGLPPASLFQAWLSRSWLGVLPLAEAALCSVVLPVLLGPDYPAYQCVVLLLERRAQLLVAARQGDLVVWAADGSGGGWPGLAVCMPQLQALQNRHRQLVLGFLFSESP